jgi:hypothetical protein
VKIIAQYLGGSHLYGLNTPSSDEDIRYVFLNSTLGEIIGLDRHDHLDKRTVDEDSFGMELRGFLNLLRKTNTQVMELLYAPTSAFTILDPSFKRYILDERHRFINSDRFFKSLQGYIYTERRLALGERAGKIGGKRFEAVERHGYSPKNMVQLFRLGYAGIEFFKSGVFPTNMRTYSEPICNRLLDIKTHPEKYNPLELVAETHELERRLEEVYNTTKVKHEFDLDYANWICGQMYKEILMPFLLVDKHP